MLMLMQQKRCRKHQKTTS